jgi:D-alanine-D-alanine ligase
MKIGILFGGQSREREVAFAGGRTVYDSLDKTLFEPVPLFIDSLGNLIHLDWQYLYKGSIRDFYPPASILPSSPNNFQVYIESLGPPSTIPTEEAIQQIGSKVALESLPDLIDMAFLVLHGPYGEDGAIQGLLSYLNIPYTGCGIFPSALGIDKALQKAVFQQAGLEPLPAHVITRQSWLTPGHAKKHFERLRSFFDFPLVIKAASQGSSIGVSILPRPDYAQFEKLVDQSFFRCVLSRDQWLQWSDQEQVQYVSQLTDLQSGLGTPLIINNTRCHHPEEVLQYVRDRFQQTGAPASLAISAHQAEHTVLVEPQLEGREFSCIVIQDEQGYPVALPPTEIHKSSTVFDYRAKYLPGASHKVTPMDLPEEGLTQIRRACEALFSTMQAQVYARIDGFYTKEGQIYLNDPNTTSGMMPSSFFFHQAAEIGLSPGQFLTYIVRTSLQARLSQTNVPHRLEALLGRLEEQRQSQMAQSLAKTRVGVILGGYSSERHISVESGRNVFEKLAATQACEPIPLFLALEQDQWVFYRLPVNVLLKDNADDIRAKLQHFELTPALRQIQHEAKAITQAYSEPAYDFYPRRYTLSDLPGLMDFAFLALHGRPGEDGELPRHLAELGLPYNGSEPEAAALTIDKKATNAFLQKQGFHVAKHQLITATGWLQDPDAICRQVEADPGFPVVAKPSDDGCSSAVIMIYNREELAAYASLIFRKQEQLPSTAAETLSLDPQEEFPPKQNFMVEERVQRQGADHFLEITCGLLTHRSADGSLRYEVLPPSEALAAEGILSLEEKFLAGEGQNITPARFSADPELQQQHLQEVQTTIRQVAEATGVTGYCRVDAFVRIYEGSRAEVIIIEINSLPGLTPATAIFHQAALHGYRPADLLTHVIRDGQMRAQLSSGASY